MKVHIVDNDKCKKVTSPIYNSFFDKESGLFARWGRTEDEDPSWSPFGPEILDLEISEGNCSASCKFCYKDNGNHNNRVTNLSLDQFKILLEKMPPTLTQIAFGICDVDTNPDFIPIMEHTREKGIIPNFTCNGLKITPEFAAEAKRLCGACAVSIVNKEKSYNAIKMFTDAGMDQVNIHYMLSEQTYDRAFQIIDEIAGEDPRLADMNAIVFLQYKHKNKKAKFTSMLDKDKYKELAMYCESRGVKFGFDSCSANLFLESMGGSDNYEQYVIDSEPCESSAFSSYINCKGEFYPCSFCEGMKFDNQNWTEGLNIFEVDSFMDIWNNPKTKAFRKCLLGNCRNCPVYDI